MEETELRLWNWVNYYSNNIVWGEVRVNYNTFKTFEQIEAHPNYEFKEFYKPIPLTEEWLLKFGFVYDADSLTFDYEYNHFVFYLERDFKDIETFSFDSSFTETKVKYVHQLQNLYFALTGKEL